MKKTISLILVIATIVCCMCYNVSAAESDTTLQPLWVNTAVVDGFITFDGRVGNYSMVISGYEDVTRITATADLYYKALNGQWVYWEKDWNFEVFDRILAIDVDFAAAPGREYKIELEAVVYANGYGETITRTSYGIND